MHTGDPAPEQEKLCQCKPRAAAGERQAGGGRHAETGEDHAPVRGGGSRSGGGGMREGEEAEELVASEPLVDWQASSLQVMQAFDGGGSGGGTRRGAAALQVFVCGV